jgi:ubiquinone/menaquinone biosynthesis C-methylase UbiE
MSGWRKKRTIMRRYDLTVDMYDSRYAEEQTAKYTVALESLGTEKLGLVLDAGCGTGLLFPHVAKKADAIVGLDISKKTLLKARERAKSFENVHLVNADSDTMPFNKEIFNHIFAMTLIQNAPNPATTLNEIRRISEDNALFVITGLKKVFSLRSFRNMLENARLDIIAVKQEDNLKCYVAICARIHH